MDALDEWKRDKKNIFTMNGLFHFWLVIEYSIQKSVYRYGWMCEK